VAGKTGKPTRLTQDALDKIVEGVKLGMPMKFAAQRAGVTERTVQRWIVDAKNGANGLKASLLSGIKEAEGDFVAQNLKVIDKAARSKQWAAAAWLLERRHNEYFSANKAENVLLRKQVSELLKQIAETRGTSAPQTPDSTSLSPSIPSPEPDNPPPLEVPE
jgi:predicted transcriptional regulator